MVVVPCNCNFLLHLVLPIILFALKVEQLQDPCYTIIVHYLKTFSVHGNHRPTLQFLQVKINKNFVIRCVKVWKEKSFTLLWTFVMFINYPALQGCISWKWNIIISYWLLQILQFQFPHFLEKMWKLLSNSWFLLCDITLDRYILQRV